MTPEDIGKIKRIATHLLLAGVGMGKADSMDDHNMALEKAGDMFDELDKILDKKEGENVQQ